MKSNQLATAVTLLVVSVIVAVAGVFLWWNPALASGIAFIGASRRFAAHHVEHLAGSNRPWAYHPLTLPLLRLIFLGVGCVLSLLGALLPLAHWG